MRFFIAACTAALVIAALCGAGLAWDGSYDLFKTLDLRVPYIPHNRLQDFFLYLPALATSYVTENLGILRTIFGLSFAIVPVASLAASWWIVCRTARGLFVWPALSIGLGLVPGQLDLSGEFTQAVQLFWPVLLTIVLRLPTRSIPIAAVFTVLTFIAHPTACVLLGFAALAAAVLGLRYGEDRTMLLVWALGFALLALARYAEVRTDSLELAQLFLTARIDAFRGAVNGGTLAALEWTWGAATATFLASLVGGRTRGGVTYVLRFCAIAAVAAAGIALTMRALDPGQWTGELDFRAWAMWCSLPLMLLAVLDGCTDRPFQPEGHAGADLRFREGVVQAAGCAFFIALTVQSLEFSGLTNRLQYDLAHNSSPCVPFEALGNLQYTAFNNWSLSTFAILQQSRTPKTVVLLGNSCQEAQRTGRPQLILWDPQSFQTQWFDLGSVESRLPAPSSGGATAPPKR
jgi:hypothetical protein